MSDVKKRGKEAIYKLDIPGAINAGATVKPIKLEKVGADGKTYEQDSQSIVIDNLNQFLAALSGNEPHCWQLASDRILNPMLQANDRRKLAIKAEGPVKAINDQIEALSSNPVMGFSVEQATEFVVNKYKAAGLVPADYVHATA